VPSNTLVFAIAVYLSRPQLDVPTTVAFSYALAAAFQRSLGERAEAALRVVQSICEAMEATWRAQQTQPSDDNRPTRIALVNAWSAMVNRVEQYTRLPPERHPAQSVAVQLHGLLAPDGLSVAKATSRSLWSTVKARLEVVRDERLADDLRRIAGAEFVDEVSVCHRELGRVLRITEAGEVVAPGNLLELLREHSQAVSDYVVQVAATVKRDDPASVKAALDALKPIDDVREMAARGAGVTTEAQPSPQPTPQPVDTAAPTRPVAQPAQPTPATPAAPTGRTVPPTRPSVVPPVN
jgi:hypothetical protein